MKIKNLLFVFFLFFSLSSSNSYGQIQVDTTFTVNELVEDYFNSGILVDISNVTFNGLPGDVINAQTGRFSGGLGDGFPLNAGLMMATGHVSSVLNTNVFAQIDFDQFLNEEEDISLIVDGQNVNNCAVLEFDAVVVADALVFNYVFASYEYQSYTCSNYNDSFGLFVSGPGISGPYSNAAVNIALIPGSNVPVAINSVNSGQASVGGNEMNCEMVNPNWIEDSQYFINNVAYEECTSDLNGFTQTFQAFTEVQYGETYHLKFAVCDVSDGAFDSGVFLGEDSFAGIMINNTEDLELETLSLFPNPATDNLTIELEESTGQTRFDILDIQGRLIRSVSANGQEQISIPVQDLDLGFYVINQYTEDALVARAKFVKE